VRAICVFQQPFHDESQNLEFTAREPVHVTWVRHQHHPEDPYREVLGTGRDAHARMAGRAAATEEGNGSTARTSSEMSRPRPRRVSSVGGDLPRT